MRERRFVAFVMSVPSVGIHVDDDIAVEGLPEVHGQPHDLSHGLRVLTVDVENRDLEHLSDAGGVKARATLVRRCGESDLIVHDNMQRTAGSEARQLAHV